MSNGRPTAVTSGSADPNISKILFPRRLGAMKVCPGAILAPLMLKSTRAVLLRLKMANTSGVGPSTGSPSRTASSRSSGPTCAATMYPGRPRTKASTRLSV